MASYGSGLAHIPSMTSWLHKYITMNPPLPLEEGRVRVFVHEWLHVRSLYFPDPEGNLLEFVCYDASVG